jgi:hypothetical protein
MIALKTILALKNDRMRILRIVVAIITICLPLTLWAQNKDGSIHVPDTLDAAYIKITGVKITGNKLTKPQIVVRELDFKIGDSLATFQKGKKINFNDRNFYPGDSSELRLRMNYSRENLINAKLFLTVNLSLKWIKGNEYALLIDVVERHYWWLFPIPKLNAPNFNEWIRDIDWSYLSMGLFFSHNNLFGLNHQTSVVALAGKTWAIAVGYKIPWVGKGKKVGLGLVSKDVDLFYYGVDFHFYQSIGRKWYVAEMFKAENASGENAPYYYQLNITDGKDFIRGFDLYTLKGDQMYYTRNNIKFELIKPSIKKVKEGQEKNKFKALQYAFYLNAFADAGYEVNKFTDVNPYHNKMLFSWGLGIDFVTYYDLVIRFEYAFTSINTNGFFFGFGMPI